jgi:RNA polymerase sigma-70 factor (ECF subfamily)
MSDPVTFPESPDEAVPRLLEAYGDRLYRLGRRLCHEPDYADDLVQETFLRAYRGWDRFEGRSQALTWLYTIASRACRRLERRRAGEPRRIESLSRLLTGGEQSEVDVPSEEESALEGAIRSEEIEHLHRAISRLPPEFRLPLVLKELEGLSLREVGEILGVREATVKTRLHRARMTIREELVADPDLTRRDESEHTGRQCSDLLTAKIGDERICARCSKLLAALDRADAVCAAIPAHPLPPELRDRVLDTLLELEGSD